MPEPVFILYPETYAALNDELKSKRFSTGSEEYPRLHLGGGDPDTRGQGGEGGRMRRAGR